MSILIKNCNLISMSENREKFEEGIDILIEEDEIKQIGKNIQIHADEIIDASGKVIMPGLINTHAHISMSIFRETLDGYTLQEWLNQKIWPMEDKLQEDDIYYASLLSCIEMIKTGTTTINDMYFMTDNIIKAAIDSGVRLQATRTLMDLTGDGDSRLKEMEELIEKYNNKYSNITINVGIHGFYTSNDKYIPKCAELARKYNLPIHIHFCENSKEVEDIKKIYNTNNPVELLKKYFKGLHVILAHSVKLTEDEIDQLKELDICISHCPVSNLKLGCGIAKISYMVSNGITVSLGTDGQGSGSNLDLFETMKYTALLQKGINEDPKDLPAYEVIKMATINGAKALCLEDKIGSIEEGKKADVIILNLDNVSTKPINNIFSEIVYNVKGYNVETTIIDGKIVMQDKKVRNIEENIVYSKCEEIIKRIKN